ncbi:MAG: (deoxy)nucleoside triphosphate pyrophosphohydrolase [Vicinamibacterales bacterium]|nr:(deoxy)nucleoside triphosphate pyrophosphohydrolase [Vicinamibacterales bacterium]HJO16982.1 (deoxy)nucleoside triphosphate pyrophosphohydrolase [Vicinamibacterales bacterium]
MSSVPLDVVAAVVEQRDHFLVTQRAAGDHLGGCWEFPGGKLESGESLTDALRREMREELGVEVEIGKKIDCVEHAYPDRTVCLHFYHCQLKGKPRSMLKQRIRWVKRRELATLEFPLADKALIVRLTKVGTEVP